MHFLLIKNRPLKQVIILFLAMLPSMTKAQSVTTIAGNGIRGFSGDGATPVNAQISGPSSILRANDGSLYIADTGNHRIRRISANRGAISTIAGTGSTLFNGDGTATTRNLNTPTAVAIDASGNIYVTDTGNHVIRRIDTSGNMTTIAGTQVRGFSGDGGAATSAQLNAPSGIYIRGDSIYVSDTGNNKVRRINSNGIIHTIAGLDTTDGLFLDNITATKATLKVPLGIFVDTKRNVYIADSENHRIRFLSKVDGNLTTIAGTGIPGYSGDGGLPVDALLAYPSHIIQDEDSVLYIADRFNQRIRQIIPNRHIRTISGNGIANFKGDNGPANRAQWKNPTGFYHFGDTLFVVDQGNNRIRTIVPDGQIGPANKVDIAPGNETKCFSIKFTGNGKTSINGMRFTARDLQTATGFKESDVSTFFLYENVDNTLTNATRIGALSSDKFSVGKEAFISVYPARIPQADQSHYYILSVVLSKNAIENHGMAVEIPIGALSTNIGGYGTAIDGDDSKSINVDITSTKIVFERQPEGSLSGNFLSQQPTLFAIDENGLIDSDFSDTVKVYTSGSGKLFGNSAIAKSGKITFTSLRYDTDIDDEKTFLIARNDADNKHSALESLPSDSFLTNISNDAPLIQLESSYFFIEDDPIGLRLPMEHTIYDVDDSNLTIGYSSEKTEVILTDTSITIRPLEDHYGLDTLTISARDALGLETSKNIFIHIQPVNDYPVFSSLDTLRIIEDDTLSIPLTSLVIDTDNTPSELEMNFYPSNGLYVNHIVDEEILKIWTDQEINGLFTLEVESKDLSRISQSKEFIVVVEPQNDPPKLSMDRLTILQGRKTRIDLNESTEDIDSTPPNLFWTAEHDSIVAVEIDSNGISTLRPLQTFHGQREIVFKAHNQDGSSSTDTLILTIKRVNSAPILSPPDTLHLSDEETLHTKLDSWVNDVDDSLETLTWSISKYGLPGAILQKNILIWEPPVEDRLEFYTLDLAIEDPYQGKDSGTVIIALDEIDPLLTQVPTINFPTQENIVFDLSPYISLQTNEIILESPQTLIATYEASTKLIHIKTINNFKGHTFFTIIAKSILGRKMTVDVPVVITNPTPTMKAFPDIFLRAGETFKFSLDHFAMDDEPVDSLTWNAIPESGIQVSIHKVLNTATISGNKSQKGLKRIEFIATDKQGATAKQTLKVTIHDSGHSSKTNLGSRSVTELDIVHVESNSSFSTEQELRKKIIIRELPEVTLYGLNKTTVDLNKFVESNHNEDQLSWRAHITPNRLFSFEFDASSQFLSISARNTSAYGILYLQASDDYGIATTVSTPIKPSFTLRVNPGDFNNDGLVNLIDFFILADVFGQTLTDAVWNPSIDLAPNGKIDFDDFFLFTESFQESKTTRH